MIALLRRKIHESKRHNQDRLNPANVADESFETILQLHCHPHRLIRMIGRLIVQEYFPASGGIIPA